MPIFFINIFQFSKFTKFMTWRTTSKKRGAPYFIGDDVCYVLKQTKLKNPPPNKRFPDGITVILSSANVCSHI